MHFERGRSPRKAVEYHVLAAQKAIRRSAYREAVDHLNRGLDFMKLLPDNDECRRQELALQTALGSALVATRGYGVEEVGQSYTRAQELSRQLDEPGEELASLWGLAQFRVTRGELDEAGRLGDESPGTRRRASDLRARAPRPPHPGHDALLLGSTGAGPRASGDRAVARAAPAHAARDELEESLVYCRSLLGLVLWILGYPDQALERCHEAVAHRPPDRSPDEPRLAPVIIAVWCCSSVTRWRRPSRDAEALLKIAADHGLPQWTAWGNLLQGWVRSLERAAGGGAPALCQALASWSGDWGAGDGARPISRFWRPRSSGREMRGWVCRRSPRRSKMVAEHGERVNEAEILRLKGKLLQDRISRRRRRSAFARPSTSPAANKPGLGSCGLR